MLTLVFTVLAAVIAGCILKFLSSDFMKEKWFLHWARATRKRYDSISDVKEKKLLKAKIYNYLEKLAKVSPCAEDVKRAKTNFSRDGDSQHLDKL